MKLTKLWIAAMAAAWMALPCGLSTTEAMARMRTENEMEALAAQWLRTDDIRRVEIPSVATATRSASVGEAPYAVYVPASGLGYVVLATAEEQTPLLGFSATGNFDVATAPPALTEMLAATAGVPSVHLTRAVDTVEPISPLLGRIAYGQDAPYYNLCPLIGEDRAVTGCVATAMAEVMAYYRYPAQMTGDAINYIDSTGVVVSWDPSTTVFRWDDILDAYPVAYVAPDGTDSLGAAQRFCATRMLINEYNLFALDTLYLAASADFSGEIQLFLTTEEGQLVCPVGLPQTFSLRSRFYYRQWWFSLDALPGISAELPDGDYRLCTAFRAAGETAWSVVGQMTSSWGILWDQSVYLPLHKQGRTYTVDGHTFDVAYDEAQAEAVATLCAAAGAAAHASYGVDATGAWSEDMAMGFYRNLGYDDGLEYIFWNLVPPTATVESEILAELQAGRPVLAAGTSIDGYSHQFVIDGVQQVDSLLYFHFNWGWDGYDNGYFVVNLDHRQRDGADVNEYSYEFDYLLGLKPDDGEVSPIQLLSGDVTATSWRNNKGTKYLVMDNIVISNGSPRTFVGQVWPEFVDVTDSTRSYRFDDEGSDANIAFDHYQTYFWYGETDGVIPDGQYRVELRAKENGSNAVVPLHMKSTVTIQIGDVPEGIENVRSDVQTATPQRFTMDGRPIAEGAVVHGAYIQKGKVLWAK